MTDTEIAELERKEKEVWKEYQAAKESIRPIETAWYMAFNELCRARMKRSVMAELTPTESK